MTTQVIRVFLLVALLFTPAIAATAAGKDIRSLQRISTLYVDLDREFTPDESQIRTWTGKLFPGPTFCKGRYVAKYKDRSGTYFAPPADCAAPMVFGVWVPDNPEKDGYDTWLIVKRSEKDLLPLIDWMDRLEAGNFRKSGFTIVGAELIDAFAHAHELSSSP